MKTRFKFTLNTLWILMPILLPGGSRSQDVITPQPIQDIRTVTPQTHVFIHATIWKTPEERITDGTLVIRNGRVDAVGQDIPIPKDGILHDLQGKFITPGFIDLFGAGLLNKETFKDDKPSYWNEKVRPERDVTEPLKLNEDHVKTLREAGFIAAVVIPPVNIFRGHGALVYLGDKDFPERLLRPRVAQVITAKFEPPMDFQRRRPPTYPTSLMGTFALIRQVFLDTSWYRNAWLVYTKYPDNPRPQVSHALEALIPAILGHESVIFVTDDEWNFLRAARIAQEFRLRAILRTDGQEYQRIDLIRATGFPAIIPLAFPKAPDVSDPDRARRVKLSDLMHWELAPSNPSKVHEAGIPFALTADGVKSPTDVHQNLRKAIRRGLNPAAALRALTMTPARLLGVSDFLGDLQPGKSASFIISNKDLLEDDGKILEIWISGHRYVISPEPKTDPRGSWKVRILTSKDTSIERLFRIEGALPKLTLEVSTSKVPALETSSEKTEQQQKTKQSFPIQYSLGQLSFVLPGEILERSGRLRFSGVAFDNELYGTGELEDGTFVTWSGKRTETTEKTKETKKETEKEPEQIIASLKYPFGAFGRSHPIPEQPPSVFIRNATLWTLGPIGKLDPGDLLVVRGKIKAVGPHLTPPQDALIIDGSGLHITPGLIDAHSHTAITGGVNEFGQTISAEVRIEDALDPEDNNIYRQLAGGLTMAHLLHGSANPIGGVNQVIKLRWGASDLGLKYDLAPPTIKFALGENPKQSNWDTEVIRYPQTRMGVEAIIRDRFQNARDYQRVWEEYLHDPHRDRRIPPRKDLELETLARVLNKEIFIHAHSYRQDEILALARLAKEFGISIACFQHVLEGYKVAPEIARYGAGASTFSDWWAYKFEVYDAIPYNGALMWRQGVVVSFNSDDDDLARRLNLEAAKAVKYGGVPEDEALKFVTLNPAKQLKVDAFVGSLEVGKDADFVIWNGHPLDTRSIVLQTWIEGRKYFDRKEDLAMREEQKRLRAALIQKILEQNEPQRPTQEGKESSK